MDSVWWILVAFVVGGYAGAMLVGLMAMTGSHEEERPQGRAARTSRMDIVRRRRHAPVDAQPAHSGLR